MKEITIRKILSEKRKSRCITQEQLSEYMGVSKAAVSQELIGNSAFTQLHDDIRYKNIIQIITDF